LDIVASGALRCGINNGGCWKQTQMGKTYSACRVIFTKISRLTNKISSILTFIVLEVKVIPIFMLFLG